jgi:hypothetical protein
MAGLNKQLTIYLDIVQVIPSGTYICDLLAMWEQTKSNNKFTIRRKYFFEDSDKILEQESLWTSDPVGFDLTFSQVSIQCSV